MAIRAKIVLAAAAGHTNCEIATQLCVSPKTVSLWRRRFLDSGLAGIEKEAARGKRMASPPPKVVRRILQMTVHQQPPGSRSWTTRSLAKALGISPSMVHRVWKANGVSPQGKRPSSQ